MSVALGIQHVKRMRLVVLSSVASLSLFMFLHVTAGKTMVSFVRSLSRERHDFRKKKKSLLNIKYMFNLLYSFWQERSSF